MKKINMRLLTRSLIAAPLLFLACLSTAASGQFEEIVYGKYEIVSYAKFKGLNVVFVRTWSPSLGIQIMSKEFDRGVMISSAHRGKLENCFPFPAVQKRELLLNAAQTETFLPLMEEQLASSGELNSEDSKIMNETLEFTKAAVRFALAADANAPWYMCALHPGLHN